eukprot:PhM_4_TR12979/c0_g1_i1/m.63592/K15271/HFM1, MER3; ATP-dependent DNA helicase HFM1/MER3
MPSPLLLRSPGAGGTPTTSPAATIIDRAEIERCLGPLAPLLPHSSLNEIQSQCFHTLLFSDTNMVIAAPTGSGKTLLMELAMIRLFAPKIGGSNINPYGTAHKAVYITPVKALASEKHRSWESKFGRFGLNIHLETGDSDLFESDPTSVASADIIVTTPERWDSITRRWKEGLALNLVTSVALVLIDEVHTLHEERGAVLEALVSRMKTIHRVVCAQHEKEKGAAAPLPLLRFVAVSGTMPNAEDIGEWLDVPKDGMKIFSDSMRPIPLNMKVISFGSNNHSNNPFGFDRLLCFKLFPLVQQYSDGKPSLIFCPSRRETENAALAVAKDAQRLYVTDAQVQRKLATVLPTLNNGVLRQCMEKGIGFHHAALSLNDRRAVEDMFLAQALRVVCTTTTLAVGVNLPARLVIVKGTTVFKSGARGDMALSEVAQMVGRAGRPGFDTQGTGLILTTEDKVYFYSTIGRGGAAGCMIESQLHHHLVEHLNADIALLTIGDTNTAQQWLRTTYLWVRAKKNPHYYGIDEQPTATSSGSKTAEHVENFLSRLIRSQLQVLNDVQCVVVDSSSSNDRTTTVRPTRVGKLVAKYYTYIPTLQMMINHLKPDSDMKAVLECVARVDEMKEYRIRQGDKGQLNPHNKTVRFPLTGGTRGREIKEDWQKIFMLVQMQLGDEDVDDWALKNEIARVWSSLPRLLKFFAEFCVDRGFFHATKSAWTLLRCVQHRMWETSDFLTRQLDGVGEATSKALSQNGVHTFADILSEDPRQLEVFANRHAPFGDELKAKVKCLPQYTIDIVEEEYDTKIEHQPATTTTTLTITLRQNGQERNSFNNSRTRSVWFTILVGNVNSTLLLHRRFRSCDNLEPFNVKVPFLSSDAPNDVIVSVLCESFLGLDQTATMVPTFGGRNKERHTTFARTPALKQTKVTDMKKVVVAKSPIKRPRSSGDEDTDANKNTEAITEPRCPSPDPVPPANTTSFDFTEFQYKKVASQQQQQVIPTSTLTVTPIVHDCTPFATAPPTPVVINTFTPHSQPTTTAMKFPINPTPYLSSSRAVFSQACTMKSNWKSDEDMSFARAWMSPLGPPTAMPLPGFSNNTAAAAYMAQTNYNGIGGYASGAATPSALQLQPGYYSSSRIPMATNRATPTMPNGAAMTSTPSSLDASDRLLALFEKFQH